jgi:hypothetical protein
MIKPLRKRHLQVWTVLAVIIPLGILSAWMVIPKPIKDHLFQPESSTALPIIVNSLSRDNYTVNLRSTKDGSALQLEWINKSALVSPSALIYEINPQYGEKDIEGSSLIGRINVRGIYHFALKKDSSVTKYQFILYDIIHHQAVDRINF